MSCVITNAKFLIFTVSLHRLAHFRLGYSANQIVPSVHTSGSAAVTMAPRLQFLRPCTSPVSAPRTVAQCSAYLHFYELAKAHVSRSPRSGARKYATDKTPLVRKWLKEEQLSPAQRSAKRSQRVDELQSADKLHYPGVNFVGKPTQVRDFCTQFQEATAAELETYKNDWHAVNGRVLRVRRHGRKLGFVDIIYDGCVLQIMVNFAELMDETTEYQLKVFYQLLQRGDYICKPVLGTIVMQFVLLTSLSRQL